MPTYSYECRTCGKKFTRDLSFQERDRKQQTCPKCGEGEGVRQVLEPFFARTSRKS